MHGHKRRRKTNDIDGDNDDVGYHNDRIAGFICSVSSKKCITSSLRLVYPISRERKSKDSIYRLSRMEWLVHDMNYSTWSNIRAAATRRTTDDTADNSVDHKVRLTK